MYTIKFFKLEQTKDLELYKDKILEDFKFQLTTLENVKLFLGSEFYNQFKLHLEHDYFNHTRLDGIIIYDNETLILKVIFKDIRNFKITVNELGETFYRVESINKEYCDIVIEDNIKLYFC